VPAKIAVYLERGAKRTFACAVEWPGWCRSGRDDASALEALLASAPRYARAVGKSGGLSAPRDVTAFDVVARLKGDATTDYGAPGAKSAFDERPMSAADVRRTSDVLRACWKALDAAAAKAKGKTLAKGPRGGGRELDAITTHVAQAELGYLSGLGWKPPAGTRTTVQIRVAVLEGIAASARGEIPAKGPRGGKRWTPRFFARRLAWHALDHAWEIEDRSGS